MKYSSDEQGVRVSGTDSPTGVAPVRPQIILEVIERIQLTPRMVRIIAGGPGISGVVNRGHTDSYSKIIFAHPDTDLTPPYDLDALRVSLPSHLMPTTRTYSIRRFDLENERVWIDFVTHGEEGLAGPWALRAEVGDLLALRNIGGGYSPNPDADWHLLAGDESATPAIAAALEAMPGDARGIALIEAGSEVDQLELQAPSGIEVRWLFRGADVEPGTSTVLVDAVRALPWQEGEVQVFVHGERGAMKALRPYFTEERGLERAKLSLSPYWAYGRREDRFQAEKREPIGLV